MMANHDDLKSIPVIMLTASTNEETVRRCHEQCSYYVLKCPDVWNRVECVLRELFNCEGVAEATESRTIDPTRASEDLASGDELMDAVFAVLGVEEGDSILAEDRTESSWSDEPWVLSIEDDDDVALAIRLRLQECNVQVLRASAGTEGYRQAVFGAPRAIILDYELPQGNGDYVLRRLKESPATCDIPVIVLTGRREGNIERQMRGLGASEFLTKPLDWSRLRAALETHLGTHAN
jgi:CheY-like chemotaxis protein